MKILRLTFKNLNSLAGPWEVDFKHPDYVSSGIFAITGPTGAGKTTILDAISLALYGQTPRLGRITQSENEIMSRQSGECFAEVEFETARGHFRCHWSQHRSRKQADGLLQSPRHEIAEAESGTILESKLKAVAGMVEDVTGMDFERFTRSMLLAQGGFAAFLQARPDERAPILEQITGTAIYSRISVKVHELTSEERRRLADLQTEVDGIQLLSPAEEEALQVEKSELQRAENALVTETGLIREALSWREKIAALEGELLQLDQDRIGFAARKDAAGVELEQLELAGRALKLGGDHAGLCALRNQHAKEQGERSTAAEQLPQLQLHWQAASDALDLAENELSRSKAEQARESELIRVARELDVKLGEADAVLQTAAAEIEKAVRQIREYRDTITEYDNRMGVIDGELSAAASYLGEHQTDAGLAEALTGIEQQLKSLAALDTQCRAARDSLARHAALVDTVTSESSRSENAWQMTQQGVAAAELRLAEIRAAGFAFLQGRDLSEWRDEVEAAAARQYRLGTVAEAVARIEDVSSKLAELKLLDEEMVKKRHALSLQEGELTGECELREQLVRRLQDNVILLNRVRSLEDDRRHLVDGVPCPLCGSGEHPYASGNIPQPDEAQGELDAALAGARRVREQLSLIKQELAAVCKENSRSELDLAELQKRRLNDEALCTDAFADLGVTVGTAAWSDVVRHELGLCSEALVKRRSIIQAAEQSRQEELSAQAVLSTLKDELAELDKARLAARLGQETALADRVRLQEESTTLLAAFERVLADVRCAIAPYNGMKIVPGSCDELWASLTARRSAYVRHMQARELLEKGRADVAAEKGKQLALLAESEKARADKEQQHRDKLSQREALAGQRLEQFGERSPDAEEKRLADTLRLAGEVREAALQEQNRLNAERGGLKQLVERLTLSIARRSEQLSDLETAFTARLVEAGFADEAAFLQACLPQQRFDELVTMADTLRVDETSLQTRFHDRTVALAGELDKKLTDKPLEVIREENVAASGRLSELQKAVGALNQRLQQHTEQQQRHQGRLQEIKRQKGECERWERLHSLIGSGDGKKFRNFAQGLTFELMVAHANRQLQKMSDRYILVRDDGEPLELNVIDNYQAGEIRSTKNLSGGESFIASLALSLGLSSMASRNVRVDSLFLDEGFGTLDEDALETALETLSGLQQEGKLIGIISHVPALKERIGTQIQVEAGSGGRSSLSGPGCRRIT